jgi:hypothetical protein
VSRHTCPSRSAPLQFALRWFKRLASMPVANQSRTSLSSLPTARSPGSFAIPITRSCNAVDVPWPTIWVVPGLSGFTSL